MTSPSTSDYVSLTNSIGNTPPAGSGWSVLRTTSQSLDTASFAAQGMNATAYVNSQTGQVVIAFADVATVPATLGLSSNSLENGAQTTDSRILGGDTSVVGQMTSDATDFLGEVRAAAASLPQPIALSENNTFFAGYSIGGAYAQAAAASTGFGGVSIAGPGLPGYVPPGTPVSNFTSYALSGDGIGNYSSEGQASAILQLTSQMYHYGQFVELGTSSQVSALAGCGNSSKSGGVSAS